MDRTITAIASLLWPLLVLAALIVYRRPLGRLLRSAERREWTLEIAGQKLSMGQVREQQSALISDLQRQLGTMRQELDELRRDRYLGYRLAPPLPPLEPVAPPDADEPAEPWEPSPDPWGAPQGSPPGSPSAGPPPAGPPPEPPLEPRAYQPTYRPTPPGSGVLWVDDHPENNAILTDTLLRDGVRIDTALSTDEALARMRRHRYAAIISDMDRVEQGTDLPDAGLRLLDAVNRTEPAPPIVIYCGERDALAYRERALAAGARAITASAAEVVTQLQRLDIV